MLVVEGLTCRFGTKAAGIMRHSRSRPAALSASSAAPAPANPRLLRMINRLAEPSEGRILFEGVDVTALRGKDLRQWRARSAMIFQQFNLVGRLDVLTNVLMGRLAEIPSWRSLTQLWPEEDRALAIVGAGTVRYGSDRRPTRRPAFRRPAAARRDRPSAGAGARHHSRRRADRLARSPQHANRDGCPAAHQQAFGITVICNLHSLDLARNYCDRLIGMAAGRVVFDGAPETLTDHIARELYDLEATTSWAPRLRRRPTVRPFRRSATPPQPECHYLYRVTSVQGSRLQTCNRRRGVTTTRGLTMITRRIVLAGAAALAFTASRLGAGLERASIRN